MCVNNCAGEGDNNNSNKGSVSKMLQIWYEFSKGWLVAYTNWLIDWWILLTDLENYSTFQVQLKTKMLTVDNTIKHYTCLQWGPPWLVLFSVSLLLRCHCACVYPTRTRLLLLILYFIKAVKVRRSSCLFMGRTPRVITILILTW